MSRRIVAVILLLALVLLLTGCNGAALRPEALEDRVRPHLLQALDGVRAENWQLASDSLTEAHNAWKKVKPLASLVSTLGDMEKLEESMTRARAAVEARARANALEEVAQSIQELDEVVNW